MTKRAVFVSGAAGGLGRAICALLHSRGWYVIGLDRNPADDVVDRFVEVDLGDRAALRAAVADVITAVDLPIGGLINNAAVQVCKPLTEITDDEWDATLGVNLTATHVLTASLAPRLIEARGSIVNVSSVHANASTLEMSAYATSKAGLVAYTRVAAQELGPQVRVNALLPGPVDTPMLTEGLSRRPQDGDRTQALDRLAASLPIGRIASAAEIAGAIEFLLDGAGSSFMTGASLVADGGMLARLPGE